MTKSQQQSLKTQSINTQSTGIDFYLYWVYISIFLILSLVIIGGLTRLTGSGLSITEWKPITGVLPPLHDSDWQDAFLKYQAIPQFSVLNPTMQLHDFKIIFLWEFTHRLVARFIGLWIGLGTFYIFLKMKLNRQLRFKLVKGILLISLQALLGWLMVKSGLTKLIYVSHYRLAAHFILGMIILGYWTHIALSLKSGSQTIRRVPVNLLVLGTVLGVQLFLGALMAGLKAGFISDTFPGMNGVLIPDVFEIGSGYFKWFDSPFFVHFIHRWFPVVLIVSGVYSFFKTRKPCAGLWFLGLLFSQYFIGVLTILNHVPTALASFHQLTGSLLVICWVIWSHRAVSSAY